MVGVNAATLAGNETDKLALLAIKAMIIQDPLNITSSWNESLHFCHWQGVSCSTRHERVTQLNLSSQKLSGYISTSIGNLSFLRTFDLSNNSFQGEIPNEIIHLFRLETLVLANNSLRGQIPSNISNCRNLRIFKVSRNKFTGKIPFGLSYLSKLVQLDLDSNNLEGNIPHSLGNISSLEVLRLGSNYLEGHVPPSLGQLKNLVTLIISLNNLSGEIPESMYNLSCLRVTSFSCNGFEGRLPLNIGLTLPNTEVFLVAANNFSGSIPISFSNASNLWRLELSRNKFSGGVPPIFKNLKKLTWLRIDINDLGTGKANDLSFIDSLTNCSILRVLYLDECNFGGELPTSMVNLSLQLQIFSVESNKLSGCIPHDIGNLINLNALNLHRNQLVGTIPTTIGKLYKLQEAGFGSNELSGQIPSTFGNLTLLRRLWLEENNFQGSIPSSLGNCQNLELLHLYGNFLNGTIPREVIGLKYLSLSLNLSRNNLSGSLPSEVGKMKFLVELDLSQNQLSGNIPNSLGDCINLVCLYIDHNSFEGEIPKSLSLLKVIEVMDLSHNNLFGHIPKDFANLTFLGKLNLSFNDLDGEVPVTGVFSNISAISIAGNEKLCGGIPEINSNANLKATNGFSNANLIGVGSFGSVYKGNLESNQASVAVKVFNLERRGASKSFMAECETLRNTRHRNLVRIVTACSSVDYQGNDFMALVYEFMPNGSLENWLHPQSGSEGRGKLTLLQKLNIVIDVASALDYLHNQIDMPIIHCDLKPSNILLDQDMAALIGDFGLSKIIVEDDDIEASNNSTSTIGIKGTIGYAAPEYGMGSEVSSRGDMYSFGILLLEIFTGKRPTDDSFIDGMNLNLFVKMALPERVMEIVDHDILLEVEEEKEASSSNHHNEPGQTRREKLIECLISILTIGVKCSEELPSNRIQIHEACKQLLKFKGTMLSLELLSCNQN
ncbi:putative receptor-like protein kinase At3g47110 [Ziziphus jujuba]|uniref:Receptor-like protein kinase At3g47110 n=1 Tax=Ziziphus jujuba TaxID=326968 RepID=A0ABM4A2N2_ZIZJJ|nr:putative receptor-like protein kinase At3g47110 [Ziziphus jujuba]